MAAKKSSSKKSYNKKWIQGATKNKGTLRAQLGVKKGETIPVSKLRELAKKPGVTGKRARLALTLRKVRRKKS